MEFLKEFDPENFTSAVERIKEFRSNSDDYGFWRMESAFLGFHEGYVAFKTSIISDQDVVISTGHCFRKVEAQGDFQAAETISYSRALANAGILIGGSIASKEEMDDLFPQSPKADPKIEATLQATLESGRVK